MTGAGELDRRITLQEISQPVSDTGSVSEGTWTDVAPPIWAKEMPVIGREYVTANQIAAQSDIVFRIRYRSNLSTKMRLLFNGQIFNIRSILPRGRKKWLDILGEMMEEA